MWFLDIVCEAAVVVCLSVPANDYPERWHKSQAACEQILLETAIRWKPGKDGAWKFNCVPVVKK